MPGLLVIDNYDSFTYNLVQYLGELGQVPEVVRNDAVSVADVIRMGPSGVVISPGPCSPAEAGISTDLVRELGPRTPILGVCLGHQCIGEAYGGKTVRAPSVMHGKVSTIHHDGRGVFTGLPSPLSATRYHSLVIDPGTLPASLEVSARTADGVIMGVRHREHPVEGVQFHPESILTEAGHELLRNFVEVCAGRAPVAA
jgi:anthranilate synthase/aminodeoxychorismate synthase-like glutamine amidotransferase